MIIELKQYDDIRKFGIKQPISYWKDDEFSWLNLPHKALIKLKGCGFSTYHVNGQNALMYYHIIKTNEFFGVERGNQLVIDHEYFLSFYYIPRGVATTKFINGIIKDNVFKPLRVKSGILQGYQNQFGKFLDPSNFDDHLKMCFIAQAKKIISEMNE